MQQKILVINDNSDIREMVQIILSSKGYETFEASSGKQGIELAIQNKPDLILLDIMMPEMNGFETCQILKSSIVTEEIPIIFFSSLTTPKDKIKGLELGAVDYVNSVVDQGELLARVHTHLHIQSLTSALKKSNEELMIKQRSLDENLNAAMNIQKSFLPVKTIKLKNIDFSFLWIPANVLGGDIFNVIECENNQTVIYMADVSGHDVPSALVTVSISQFINQLNSSSHAFLSPKEVIMQLEKEYPIERFDRYFTIFYLVLDTRTGTFSYCNAGHPPPIILSNSKPLKLLDDARGIIGLNLPSPFDEGHEKLIKGDKIILYSDGVTDLTNSQDEFYGMERFTSLLEKIKHESAETIVETIKNALKEFSKDAIPKDDISVMCIELS